MEMLSSPLNVTQLEILKLFSRELSDTDLLALKRLMVRFLADKATRLADEAVEQKGWTKEDLDKMAHTHLRTPYKHPLNKAQS